MRRVIRCWLISSVGLCAAQAASAADMPVKAPVYKAPGVIVAEAWSGFYVGGEIGGAWSQFDWSHTNFNYFNTLGAALVGTDFSHSASGVIGGAFAGYNHQTGPWVLGIEVSVAATSLSRDEASPFFPALDTFTSKLQWLTTAVGRVGYARDRWLVYAKAGYAGAQVELTMDSPAAAVRANDDMWANGWTVGAGVDYLLGTNLTLGVVYNYVDLRTGNETVTCPACGIGVGFGTPVVDGDIQVQSVMARLSFLFGR